MIFEIMRRSKTHRYTRRIIMAFLVVGFFASCKSARFHVDKKTLNQYFDVNSVSGKGFSGLAVYDLHADKMIFNYNSEKGFTPASITKLLTYYTVLQMLGDSIPAMEYCIVDDSIYFTGTGDPTWLYDTFDHSQSVEILSDSSFILNYVPRSMADNRFGPGWSWDDYTFDFSVEKSSFPIYGNRLSMDKVAGNRKVEIYPNSMEVLVNINTYEKTDGFESDRLEFSNDFFLIIESDSVEVKTAVPFIYSDELFVNLLSDTLHRSIHLAGHFPDCNRQKSYDIPTDSVLAKILLNSDNFLSEQMLLVISSTLRDSLSSRSVIELMTKNQLADIADDITWVDGSGLSRYNLISPNSIISVLKKIYLTQPREKIFKMLPEAGCTGSLKESFTGLSGKMYAKTGSMSGVYNLSGYLVTDSGKTLAFSFMNNNFTVPVSLIRQEMEKVLAAFMDY
jgi:serine-type D-Ala-D-Ala carboxypeptidase/endopeptidase (penicillin-binding protein 4)